MRPNFTSYEFSVHDYGKSGATNDAIATEIIKLNKKNNDLFYPLMDGVTDYIGEETQYAMTLESNEPTKWYDHDQEMLLLSGKFPDVVFKLHGEGEEHGDFWDAYYKDGKMCRYALPRKLPPFDPNDLKTLAEIRAKSTDFFC